MINTVEATTEEVEQMTKSIEEKTRVIKLVYVGSLTDSFLKTLSIFLFIIHCSLILWIFGAFSSMYIASDGEVDTSPVRWISAALVPAITLKQVLKKHSVSPSGAVVGCCLGIILTTTSYTFSASLMMYFISSSWAINFGNEKKQLLEVAIKPRRPKNWLQVISNGGFIVAYLSVLCFIESGSGEFPIDFRLNYRNSWLSIAVLSTIACANGDIFASELGTVLDDNAMPRLITTGEKISRGTRGGVTWAGVIMSAVGGLVIGIAYYVTHLYCLEAGVLEISTSQWPLILTGLLGGLIGSLITSLLSASLQFSWIDEYTGVVVKQQRQGVVRVNGSPWVDDHIINLMSSFFTVLFVTRLSIAMWPK